ncbi:MAG: HNH endonuclease [Nitrososphaerota archaeon]
MNRKDFPRWKVEQVYIAQDGVCAKYGDSLEHGFHRHHKDGNPANNEIDNLELLCPECHRATLGDAVTEHRKQEEKVLSDLNRLIDECFAGKISGAVVERLIEAITLSLKVSRNLDKIDEGLESPPTSIALLKRMQETKILQETYLEGFKDGVKWLSQSNCKHRKRKASKIAL